MMPYVLSSNELCTNESLVSVDIEVQPLDRYIRFLYKPRSSKELNWLMWKAEHEPNIRQCYLSNNGLNVLIIVPKDKWLVISTIMDCQKDKLASTVLIDNAIFWDGLNKHIFDLENKSLVTRESSQAFFIFIIANTMGHFYLRPLFYFQSIYVQLQNHIFVHKDYGMELLLLKLFAIFSNLYKLHV